MSFLYNDPGLKQIRRLLRRNSTDAEAQLWRYLRNRQLYGYRFFRQYSVGRFVLDFYCPKARLAIELDGGHHALPHYASKDAERTYYLKEQKIRVIRFWNVEVFDDIDGVLDDITEALGSECGSD